MQENKRKTSNQSIYNKSVPNTKKKKKKKKRYLFLKFLILLLICIIVFMTSALYGYRYIVEGISQAEQVLTEEDGYIFTIPSGYTTSDIANDLQKEGFIDNIFIYRVLSKILGFDNAYKAGRYIISKDMNYYALMARLTSEPLKNPTVDVMIPEGKTLLETVEILESQGYIDKGKFLKIASRVLRQYRFLEDLEPSEARLYPLEGYLYPDTYKMDEGWTEEDLILRMLDEFNRVFTEEYYKRAEELGMTIDEVVTLASLIEMEALYPTDYKKISSVFHNRLNSEYMFECDATVQYARIYEGLAEPQWCCIKILKLNIHIIPISMKGCRPPHMFAMKEARSSVVSGENKLSVFLATPDGTNIYNETYEGHLADQQKYAVTII